MPTFSFAAMRRCASAASQRETPSITGASARPRSAGRTSRTKASVSAAFSSSGRLRSVEPMIRRRLPSTIARRSISRDGPGHARDEDDAPSAPQRRGCSARRAAPPTGVEDEVDASPSRTSPRSGSGTPAAKCRRRDPRRARRARRISSRERAVATTVQPARFASWIAAVPTPRPRRGRAALSRASATPSRKRFRYAVNQASGIAAASANERRARDGHEHAARDGDALGIAAAREEEENALAGALDLARCLETQDLRRARRRRVFALRPAEDPRGSRPSPARGRGPRRPRDGIRRVAIDERVGSAGLRDEDGFHRPPRGRGKRRPGIFLEREEERGFLRMQIGGWTDACVVRSP